MKAFCRTTDLAAVFLFGAAVFFLHLHAPMALSKTMEEVMSSSRVPFVLTAGMCLVAGGAIWMIARLAISLTGGWKKAFRPTRWRLLEAVLITAFTPCQFYGSLPFMAWLLGFHGFLNGELAYILAFSGMLVVAYFLICIIKSAFPGDRSARICATFMLYAGLYSMSALAMGMGRVYSL